jgi:hypothetical protein
MSSEIKLSEGINEIFPGWQATVKLVNPLKIKNISKYSTSYHEATHAFAALKTGSHVHEASRIPGPGYNGITRLNEFNPIAFMAAHAMGCSGTGHDVAVVRRMGYSPESVAAQARMIMSGHEAEIDAIAADIEMQGTISGNQAWNTMEKAANPEVEVFLIDPEGKPRHFVAKTRRSEGFLIDLGIIDFSKETKKRGPEESTTGDKDPLLDNILPFTGKIHQEPLLKGRFNNQEDQFNSSNYPASLVKAA